MLNRPIGSFDQQTFLLSNSGDRNSKSKYYSDVREGSSELLWSLNCGISVGYLKCIGVKCVSNHTQASWQIGISKADSELFERLSQTPESQWQRLWSILTGETSLIQFESLFSNKNRLFWLSVWRTLSSNLSLLTVIDPIRQWSNVMTIEETKNEIHIEL